MNIELGTTSGILRMPTGAARRRARVAAGAVELGGVVLLLAAPSASARPGRGGEHDARVTPCAVVASTVHGGTATFTVGPAGCTQATAPLSFSTYALPGGRMLPFADQVLFAHAAENGTTYLAGSYTLTAELPACSWQADLYLGPSQDFAPHVHPINGMNQGWDYAEDQSCVSPPPVVPTPVEPTPVEPSPVPAPVESTPAAPAPEEPSVAPTGPAPSTPTPPEPTPGTTPAPAASEVAPAPVASPSPSTTSDVLSAAPSPSPSVTYVSEVLSAPAAPAGSSKGVLAATGSSAGVLLGGAAVLVATGVTLTLFRRRAAEQSR